MAAAAEAQAEEEATDLVALVAAATAMAALAPAAMATAAPAPAEAATAPAAGAMVARVGMVVPVAATAMATGTRRPQLSRPQTGSSSRPNKSSTEWRISGRWFAPPRT